MKNQKKNMRVPRETKKCLPLEFCQLCETKQTTPDIRKVADSYTNTRLMGTTDIELCSIFFLLYKSKSFYDITISIIIWKVG